MLTTVKKIDIPPNTRMIVTSDIHGHYFHLKNVLKKVGFSKDDILFIVGDIIEKGPLCLKTLRYIMELCSEYKVYPLMGNVDAHRLLMLDNYKMNNCEKMFEYIYYMQKDWGGCLFLDMLIEQEIHIDSISDLSAAMDKLIVEYKKEIEFLRSLPTIIETQNYIFVHGGLPSDDIDSFEGTDIFTYLKNDAFMEKGFEFDKYVVVGHWPVTLYNGKISSSNPIINSNQKIISIDGGCGLKRDGQLNALIIDGDGHKNISYEYYDDFSTAIAQTPQKKSSRSINIRYTDSKISILEKGEEFSFAEHRSTGYRLWIHNDYIFNFGVDAKCDNYTDYILPVNIGDKLSIIKKTSRGYIVKKDGISGWYYGTLKFDASNG